MAEADIDLYADDMDGDLNDDDDFDREDNVDLYDDVISSSRRNDDSVSSASGSPRRRASSTSRRFCLYVGNLTWWTTDVDLTTAMRDLNVSDVVEVKFFENRANGQSKGFCTVTLGSETSVRTVLEKLPRKEIHGQTPHVFNYTKDSYESLEELARKSGGRHEGPPPERRSRDREWENRSYRNDSRPMNQDRPRGRPGPPYQHMPRMPHAPHMQHHPPGPPPPQYQHGHGWIPPPQMHRMHGPPPPVNHPGGPPPVNTSIPPPQGPPPVRPGMPLPANMRMPPPHAMPSANPAGVNPDPRGPPPSHPDWQHRPAHNVGPPQSVLSTSRPPPISSSGSVVPTGVPPVGHVPNPHINPAFLQQGVAPQVSDMFSRPPPAPYPEYRPTSIRDGDSQKSSMSDTEFEEVMGKNRSVSSSAISRAVSDASAGDYASAIETLVTAISLIKQSKVAEDERCKILISSLQDTLHGIESKSYGSRTKERDRSRERERSRERDRERTSRREKSRRDRSRSRDRDYRERSRERDRYHEDRYREKDRDHERERRSRH